MVPLTTNCLIKHHFSRVKSTSFNRNFYLANYQFLLGKSPILLVKSLEKCCFSRNFCQWNSNWTPHLCHPGHLLPMASDARSRGHANTCATSTSSWWSKPSPCRPWEKMGKPSKNGDLSAKYEDLAGRDQDLLGRDWGIWPNIWPARTVTSKLQQHVSFNRPP